MGLAANIPSIEAARQLEMASAIAIAFGNAKALASAVFAETGSAKLAQRIEIAAFREKGLRG
jgi:hypothetical protein